MRAIRNSLIVSGCGLRRRLVGPRSSFWANAGAVSLVLELMSCFHGFPDTGLFARVAVPWL